MFPAYGLSAADYYEGKHRPGANAAQGDLFAEVPFFVASGFQRSRRRREDYNIPAFRAIGVVCSHTRGHAVHPYRQVAPLLTIETLVNDHGLDEKMGGLLTERRRALGYMYVPYPDTFAPAAVCLFRMTLVHQNLLDGLRRVEHLSQRANRILVSQLVELVSGSLFDPDALTP
jgi:hypothetical protein